MTEAKYKIGDTATGYCMRCKKKVDFKVVEVNQMKSGAHVNKGKCPVKDCNTTVCAFSK